MPGPVVDVMDTAVAGQVNICALGGLPLLWPPRGEG